MTIQSMDLGGKRKGFTAYDLKLIAIISMLIDHIGHSLVWPMYLQAIFVDGIHTMGDKRPEEAIKLYFLYMVMRSIGRIAYPIFAFMLVEGFLHTSNLKRYGLRLLAFALISEIPYNLGIGGSLTYPASQNIMWALLIGLILLYFLEKLEDYPRDRRILLTSSFIFIGEGVASLIRANAMGATMFIGVLYVFRKEPKWQLFWGTVALSLMTLGSIWIQGFAILSFILLRRYNGRRGKENKYLFYIFYPGHLLALALISKLVFGG